MKVRPSGEVCHVSASHGSTSWVARLIADQSSLGQERKQLGRDCRLHEAVERARVAAGGGDDGAAAGRVRRSAVGADAGARIGRARRTNRERARRRR